MALRFLNTSSSIYKYHSFLSFLPSSSTIYHRYRYYGKYSHYTRNNNKLIKLIPYHLLNNDDDNNIRNNSYKLYNKNNIFHGYKLYHVNKYYFNNTPIRNDNTSSSEWIKYTKYINPIFLISKFSSIIYNICYWICHPSEVYNKFIIHLKHFVESSKLMWTDIKTARKILFKMARGNELTYRERRQLRRVALDVLRFVPMIIIILIPFLEATLPILLILFPNMLPSRFQSEHMKLEKRKKLLAARIGLAAFFEDTLHEFVKETKRKKEWNEESEEKESETKTIESLEKLLSKIKNNAEISNQSILKLASLFDDEMALDNASDTVLSNMCRYMQLNTFGTTTMLRKRLYDKIREVRREDQGIRKEGLDNIPIELLKQLLRERGMRADFQEWVLRANLNKWLELSLDHEVPVTLLIMSRIFTLQHIPGQDTTDMLKDTISTIGEATTKEMLVEKGGIDDPKAEKEIIERQQFLIEEEEKEKEVKEEIEYVIDPKRIRDLAESVETLTTDSAVDPEQAAIQEIKEKLQEIKDETDALWKEALLSRRIDKIIEKSSVYADETGNKFVNTLKRFDNVNDISESELKSALKDTLSESYNFSDKEIEEFLKELDVRKEKEPNIKLSKRIEKLIDDYDEDIDIKDIKGE